MFSAMLNIIANPSNNRDGGWRMKKVELALYNKSYCRTLCSSLHSRVPSDQPSASPSYGFNAITTPYLEMIIEGLTNDDLESTRALLDHWRQKTSEYILQYWDNKNGDSDLEFLKILK